MIYMEYKPLLIQKTIMEADVPPDGIDLGRPLLLEEITSIYARGALNRWMPDWIVDDAGNRIGYNKSSIDAWCE